MTKRTNIQVARGNASKAFIGIAHYVATTGALNFSIADLALIGEAWKKDRYVEPTLSEFANGLDYLERMGVIRFRDNYWTLSRKLNDFSFADLVAAAEIYDGVIVVCDGAAEYDEFFDDDDGNMNEYAAERGQRYGVVSLYNARQILFSTGLLRISADGLYIICG